MVTNENNEEIQESSFPYVAKHLKTLINSL
jgi:hypothetical protein